MSRDLLEESRMLLVLSIVAIIMFLAALVLVLR